MTMMENIKKYHRVCSLCGNTFETASVITEICPVCQEEVVRLMKRYGFNL